LEVSLKLELYNIISSNVQLISGGSSFALTQTQHKKKDRSYVDAIALTVTQQSAVMFTTMFTLTLLRALSKHQVRLIYEVLRYTQQSRDLETLHFCVAGSSITKTDKLNPAEQEWLKYSTKYFVLLILQNPQNVGRNQFKRRPTM